MISTKRGQMYDALLPSMEIKIPVNKSKLHKKPALTHTHIKTQTNSLTSGDAPQRFVTRREFFSKDKGEFNAP